jgi:hypothetical protein
MARTGESLPGSTTVPALQDVGELKLGCSMLRRTELHLKGRTCPMMRCSLGFSVRTEEDSERCRAAEGPHECWHLTPPKRVTT